VPVARPAYTVAVPTYEYKCRDCDAVFEVRRPMSEANAPAACPDGHLSSTRLLSVFASVGAGASGASSAPAMPAPRAGGCGAGCGCHP
jgi:putative FmdB family regulatory protein